MAIENDPSNKFQVLPQGRLLHPGACLACRTGNCERGYVDLAVFFDYEGQMYLCLNCAEEIGETIGMFTPDQVQTSLILSNELAAENDRLKKELDSVKPLADSIASFFANSGLFAAHPYLAGTGVEVSDAPEQDSAEPASRTDDGESESTEPTPKPRRSSNAGRAKLRDATFD